MTHSTACPECDTNLDLDDQVEQDKKDHGTQPVGSEFNIELVCPNCKNTVTIDCIVTVEFYPNIF